MVKLNVKGLDAVLNKFETLSKESQVMVQSALNQFADDTAKDAKDLAPADEGGLRKSIATEYGNGSVAVKVTAKYAAYVEFGTRKFAASYVANLPPEWQKLAAESKGKSNSGDYYDFLNSILDWVSRKGITARYSVKTRKKLKNNKADDERLLAAAEAIARSIMINGVKPHPFLYPAVNMNLDKLIKDIKDIFE